MPVEDRSPPRGRELAAVFAGGAVGGLLRTVLVAGHPQPATSWPWVTFAVNVVGAFLLGCLLTGLRRRPTPSVLLGPLLGTGLCGGLTTFSTMQLELLRMIDGRAYALAAAYAACSIAAGLLAVGVATAVVRRVGAAG